MATKTGLISAVNSFYTILITIVKVKGSLLEIINNFYPDVVSVNQASTSVITLNPALAGIVTYNANIHKQGRTVTIDCVLAKSTSGIFNGYLFEITNSEYLGKHVSNPVNTAYDFISIPKFSDYTVQGLLKKDNKLYVTIDGGIKQFTITYQTLN